MTTDTIYTEAANRDASRWGMMRYITLNQASAEAKRMEALCSALPDDDCTPAEDMRRLEECLDTLIAEFEVPK